MKSECTCKFTQSVCVDHCPDLSFEVWANDTYFEYPITRFCAAFRFLPEALDYVQYVGARGIDAVLRTVDTKRVNVSVYSAEKASALYTGR